MLTAAIVTISTALATGSSADPTTSAGARAPSEPTTRSLRNACEFPIGGQQVIIVDFTALLPESVSVGDAIEPADAKLKFVLPEAMIKALRNNGIGSIEGNAAVGISTNIDKNAAAAVVIPKTPLPETGDLAVDLPAKVAPVVKPAEAGTASFTVGPLETLLMARNEAGEATPDTRKVTCVLEKGQDAALGVVTVTPPKPATSSPATPSGTSAPSEAGPPSATSVPPKSGRKPDKGKAHTLDEPTQGCGPQPPDAFTLWTYYPLTGHVDVKKLKSGIDFGPPGYMSAQLAFWFDPETFEQCNGLVGDLLWPPSRGKFTTFRFMPTDSTVTIIQTTPTIGVLESATGQFTGTAKTDMRMTDVTVNGTPLDVGRKCHTVTPVELNLHSKSGEWNPVGEPTAGFMEADFTIPKFDGCGATEDLDPLFNGLVSGPDNHLRLDFGSVVFCNDVPPDFDGSKPCVPPLPGRR